MVTNFTTIRVSNKTKERLRALRLTEGESFENIIIRLMESKIGKLPGVIRYKISSKDYPLSVEYIIDWDSASKNIYFLDGDDNKYASVPTENITFNEDDKLYESWLRFKEFVDGLDNLIGMSAVLEAGESIDVGLGVLKRLT